MEVTQPEVVSFVMNKSEQLAGSISASVILLVFCCWELTAVPWKINGWKIDSLLKIVPF